MPPEAESPEAGSKTPILMTLSPEAAALPEAAGALFPEPQAARDSTMARDRSRAKNFFMYNPPILGGSPPVAPSRPWTADAVT